MERSHPLKTDNQVADQPVSGGWGLKRHHWWLVAGLGTLLILILLIANSNTASYTRQQAVEVGINFDDDFEFVIETVSGNRQISDLPIDVPYANLICENSPDYVAANLVYPDWLQDVNSAEFQAHAQAHKAFDRNHNLQPGDRSDAFYCLNYYRNRANNVSDRTNYQTGVELVAQYLKDNRRLSVDYRLTAGTDSLELSQLRVQLISGEEDLANKQLSDGQLHWLLEPTQRSGNQLDTNSQLGAEASRRGSAWADISQQTDSSLIKLELTYRGKTKLVELGDIVPPVVSVTPETIDASPKQSLTIRASSEADDRDTSSWAYKLLASNQLCGQTTMRTDTTAGRQLELNSSTQNNHRVCFKLSDTNGNHGYRVSPTIRGLGN